ncbi:PDZ domain-containing protein [Paenibacillus sp. N1-5-1-14]|uniref:YlbL family protein n=1 Tax=Paenibacillus radicibacter TaxID=2972488 RepID=UPI0021597861|nr:PDZ domain-containing protein [Paenibacillus radicibacter]MCR8641794.1 PDZ domain-containing protein [Paenibacillus radicibacter]
MSDREDQEPAIPEDIREGAGYEPKKVKKKTSNTRIFTSVIIGIILIYVLVFIRLPYVIYKPGTAEQIKPMVTVQGGADEERGELMLTTVLVASTNVVKYLVALVHPYQELHMRKDLFQPGESEDEYAHRQQYVMMSSQSSAIQAAYKAAKVPYHISGDGVMTMRIIDGMPAASVLRSGDIITKINDQTIGSAEDLLKSLEGKKEGDTVQVVYTREGKPNTASIALGILPDENNNAAKPNGSPVPTSTPTPAPKRAGLGITKLADVQSVKADQPEKQVEVHAGEIGGPSAGLMFALEIYNQLMAGDITKGHRIAGTGTITVDGQVGPIGGIKHKVVAASREGAEIFFAPKDYVTASGQKVNNYSEALERAKDIGTKMKIVPIGTMEDALKYLDSLSQQ